jgi:hypothetical protein
VLRRAPPRALRGTLITLDEIFCEKCAENTPRYGPYTYRSRYVPCILLGARGFARRLYFALPLAPRTPPPPPSPLEPPYEPPTPTHPPAWSLLARASPERVLPLSSREAESSCLPPAYSKVLSRRKSPAASRM